MAEKQLNLQELNEELVKVQDSLSSMNNPSEEYKINLQKALDEVKENILSLNLIVEQIKKVFEQQQLDTINKIKEISKTIKEVTEPDPLIAPKFLKFTPALTSIKVTWENDEVADEYDVFYSEGSKNSFTKLPTVTSNSVTIPGLNINTGYSVYIVARKFSGEISLPSEIFTTSTLKV